MRNEENVTIHFSAKSRHRVNNFTVYVDGSEKCSFDGGSSRSLKVTPGHHTIRVLVYNDSSEEAYWLNDLSADCEAYKEYDIDI